MYPLVVFRLYVPDTVDAVGVVVGVERAGEGAVAAGQCSFVAGGQVD